MKTLFAVLCIFSTQAFAWGPTGHRVVGKVAESFLTDKAIAHVQELLDGQSLARVSTWPDEIRSDPDHYSETFGWHFTEWPDEMQDLDESHSSGTLVTSIHNHLVVLSDPVVGKDAKQFALKFLVHLVGDLHQPLHVGNGKDRGGNDCKVNFQGKATNLHSVWDEGMINFNNLSFTEIAEFISAGRSATTLSHWREGNLLSWATESRDLRKTVYPKEVTSMDGAIVPHYCRKDIQVPASEIPSIGYEYSYTFMPVVEERLFQAGLRLAVLINQSLN